MAQPTTPPSLLPPPGPPPSSASSQFATSRVYNLWVHDERFSRHDVVINPDIFPTLHPGDLICIAHPRQQQQQQQSQHHGTSESDRFSGGDVERTGRTLLREQSMPTINEHATGTAQGMSTFSSNSISKKKYAPAGGPLSVAIFPASTPLRQQQQQQPQQQQQQQQQQQEQMLPDGDGEEMQRLVMQLPEVDAASKGNNQLQISVASHIAALFSLQPRTDVIVQKARTRPSSTADYIELTFRDQSISRSDMWRLKKFLTKSCVYVSRKIVFLGVVRAQVKEVYINGKKAACGYITEDTKIVFRSESSKIYLFIQMAKEMWDFDDSGDLYFEKAVHAFLPELFSRWKRVNANHVVSIILFTRIILSSGASDGDMGTPQGVGGGGNNSSSAGMGIGTTAGGLGTANTAASAVNVIGHAGPAADHSMTSKAGTVYKDFYKVIVDLETRSDWMSVLPVLKREFNIFQRDILQQSVDGVVVIRGQVAPASQGNILEAVNLALHPYDRQHVDRDLHLVRTGLSVIVISPGTGTMETDKYLVRLTTQRMLDNGFGLDLVCLGKPPLHTTPLFEYSSKFPYHGENVSSPADADRRAKSAADKAKEKAERRSELWDPLYYDDKHLSNPEYVFYTVPEWVDCSYYAPLADNNSTFPTKFVPRCRMYEAQMNVINHPEAIYSVPFIEESGERASVVSAPAYSINFDLYDDLVFRTAPVRSRDKGWTGTGVGVSVGGSGSIAANLGKQWNDAVNRTAACDVSFEMSPASVNRSYHSTDDMHVPNAESPERHQIRTSHLSSSYTGGGVARVGSDVSIASKWRERADSRASAVLAGGGQYDDERGDGAGAGLVATEHRSILGTSPSGGHIFGRTPVRRSERLSVTYGSRHTSDSQSKHAAQSRDSVESAPYLRQSPNDHHHQHHPYSSAQPPLDTIHDHDERASGGGGSAPADASRPISIALMRRATDRPTPRGSYVEPHRMPAERRQDWRASAASKFPPLAPVAPPLRTNLICPWNPSKNSVRLNSHLQRWPHLHPKVRSGEVNLAAPKWNSLCTPAALPLTTDSFPTPDELLELYQEYTYTVSVNDDMSAGIEGFNPMKTDDLLTELISLRLTQGFQIIVAPDAEQQTAAAAPLDLLSTPTVGSAVLSPHQTSSSSMALAANSAAAPNLAPVASTAAGALTLPSFRDVKRSLDAPHYLSMGHHVHKLVYDQSGQNVDVKRYVRKLDYTTETIPYRCYIWPKQQDFYQPRQIRFQYPLLSSFNWNYVDHMVSGYQDEKDPSRLYRAAFALIPCETAPQLLSSNSEQLDEEELRIVGFHKFIECFQRAKWLSPVDRALIKEKDRRLQHVNNTLRIAITTFSRSGYVKNELLKPGTSAASLSAATASSIPGTFSGASMASAVDDDRPADFEPLPLGLHSRRGSGALSSLTKDSKLSTIAAAMQHPQHGVRFRDRWWHLLLYQSTFVGSEAVDWMLRAFSDIETREEAVQFGNALMGKGFFVHCSGRHPFLDGYYFYRLKNEFYLTKAEADDRSNSRWFRSRASTVDPDVRERASKDEWATETSTGRPLGSGQPDMMSSSQELPQQRRKVTMSSTLLIDLDTNHKSEHKEVATLHYDAVHNPKHVFHFQVHWINCTLRMLEDVMAGWSRVAERNGLKLVETPLDQTRLLLNDNPFYTPSVIHLAIPPPTQQQLLDIGSKARFPKLYFAVELLRAFGFVLDTEADKRFPVNSTSYSYLKTSHKSTQYLHRSGTVFVLLRKEDEGGFLWITNPFMQGQTISSYSKSDRAGASLGPTSGNSAAAASLAANGGAGTFDHSAGASHSVLEALRQAFDKSHNVTADTLRKAFQSFCADTIQLTKLWSELLHAFDRTVLHETEDNVTNLIAQVPPQKQSEPGVGAVAATLPGDNVIVEEPPPKDPRRKKT
ncbi:vacuolar membrane-associated protein iml1 [Sorochytrium milnesiophthora]